MPCFGAYKFHLLEINFTVLKKGGGRPGMVRSGYWVKIGNTRSGQDIQYGIKYLFFAFEHLQIGQKPILAEGHVYHFLSDIYV